MNAVEPEALRRSKVSAVQRARWRRREALAEKFTVAMLHAGQGLTPPGAVQVVDSAYSMADRFLAMRDGGQR